MLEKNCLNMDVTQLIQADPKFIDQIVNQIKSQGIFDQWRRECLADVDTKPAYQNLTSRVDNAVASFLNKQRWRPDMVKNQVRENLRRNILELGFIEKGVDRIVEQVVQPKILPLFNPAVESSIYKFLGIQNPKLKKKEAETENVSILPKKVFRPMPVSAPIHTEDGTPPPGEEFDLEAITPSPEAFPKLKKAASTEDLAEEVSDVSMEDANCSPISQGSSPVRKAQPEQANRPGSALSAISSGDDIPSLADSPSDEFMQTGSPVSHVLEIIFLMFTLYLIGALWRTLLQIFKQ